MATSGIGTHAPISNKGAGRIDYRIAGNTDEDLASFGIEPSIFKIAEGQVAFQVMAMRLPLLGRHAMQADLPAALADAFAFIDANMVGMTLRKISETEFAVLLPIPVGGHFEQALEALLTLEKRHFGSLASRDVEAKPDHSAARRFAIGDQ